MLRQAFTALVFISAFMLPTFVHADAVTKISTSLHHRNHDATIDANMIPVNYKGKPAASAEDNQLRAETYSIPHYGTLDPSVSQRPTEHSGLFYYLNTP
jgi:hypothetical protein